MPLIEPSSGGGLIIDRRRFIAAAVTTGVVGYIPRLAIQPPVRPPFSLPFESAPSADTWFISQWYGNTAFAHQMRDDFYESGQGLHFGLDFAAPCHTPVIAIGDGVVREVDGLRRAWPHHVILEHTGGVYSLYGHLHDRSTLRIGEKIRQGEQIGITGDSAARHCHGSPHLHLEIRTDRLRGATNPIPWIEADWPTTTLGLTEAHFQMDLSNPTRWQSIYTQPDIQFWGPMLNRYPESWPSTSI